MSTRSAIIMKCKDGTYRGIYCHFDGYPEGVGQTLHEHYKSYNKVSALIELGDISSLDKEIYPKSFISKRLSGKHSFTHPQPGVTVAYGRDRKETGTEFKTGSTVHEVSNQIGHNGYVYLYFPAKEEGKSGLWTCNGKSIAKAIKDGD